MQKTPLEWLDLAKAVVRQERDRQEALRSNRLPAWERDGAKVPPQEPSKLAEPRVIPLRPAAPSAERTPERSEDPPPDAESLADLTPWVHETLASRTSRDVKRSVSSAIGDLLARKDRLLLDTASDDPQSWTPYVIAEDGSVLRLDGEALAFRAMLAEAGLNAAEPIYRWVVSDLQARAFNEGRRVRLARWVLRRDDALYISCGMRHLVRAGPDGRLTLLKNGADGVLFASDTVLPEWCPSAEPVHPLELRALQPPLEAPPEVPEYDVVCQKLLLIAWLLARMSGAWPLPALAFIGAKGSGKSTAARAVAKIFLGGLGEASDGHLSERDFKTALTGRPVCVLDNLDAEPDAWFHDALAQAVTGGVITARKLYTDSKLVSLPIQAGIVITTRTAGFADRPDILERLIPIFIGDLPDENRLDDGALVVEVLDRRSGVLAYLASHAARWTLGGEAPSGLPSRFQTIARLLHHLVDGDAKLRDHYLRAWRMAQQLSVVDLDPLVQALMAYLPPEGLRGTATQIVQALQDAGADLPYMGGGKAISRRLRELSGTLRCAGIKAQEERFGHGTLWTIWRS